MRKLIFIFSTIAFVALIIFACDSDPKEPTTTKTNEDSLKAIVARGEYLATNVAVCLVCHGERDHTKFAMPVVAGTEGGGAPHAFGKTMGVPGEITPPNITPF